MLTLETRVLGQEEPDRMIDFDRLAFFDLRVSPALLQHDLKLIVRQRTMAGHAVHRLSQLVGRQITIIVPISLLEGRPQLFLLGAGRGQRVADLHLCANQPVSRVPVDGDSAVARRHNSIYALIPP